MTVGGSGALWQVHTDEFGRYAEHATFGVRLRFVEAGARNVGFSIQERQALLRLSPEPRVTFDELRGSRTAQVGPFWASELPISVRLAARLGVESPDALGGDRPAMLTLEESEQLAAALGGRLPTESEWETCCRAGSSSLFIWGDELPPDDELARWLTWDLASSDTVRNRSGFGGLFFGEWCSDRFESADPSDDSGAGSRVIKGGGAQFWPWQEEEWVWCMPAMRMPSRDLFADGRAAARLILDAIG